MSHFRTFFSVLLVLALFFNAISFVHAQDSTSEFNVPQETNQQINTSEDSGSANNVSGNGVSLEETGAVLPDDLPRFGIQGETDPIRAFETVLLNYVINPIFLLAGGVAVIVILYSSFLIITSRAQEDSLSSA